MHSFIDDDGKERWLGNISPAWYPNESPVLCAGYKTYGDTPATPMLTEQELLDLTVKQDALQNWVNEPYIQYVHDQDGVGQCNCDATTSAMEDTRIMEGLPPIKLSPADLYMRINGGGDNGSSLEDGLRVAMGQGVGLADSVGLIWHRGMKGASAAERLQYRVTEAFLCPTFLHCASAVAKNFRLITGISWYDNYKPDGDGWLPTRPSGRAGGHAIKGYRVVQRNGVLGIAHVQSWGDWGGFKSRFVIPRSLYTASIGGWWAVRSMTQEQADLPVLQE